MTDIVVIGSVNLDFSASVSRLPAPGETVTGATLEKFPGGKGANQALAAQRLGANVKLIACVGDDATADEALALLREGGVDLDRCVTHASEATGIAMIAVAPGGENHIVVAPGANAELAFSDFEIPQADALICQLEIPALTVLDIANNFKGFFCINLAPARDIDTAVLQRADLIVVNETESAWYGDALSDTNAMIATTYGKAGAKLCQNGKLIAESEAAEINAIDTTGAGDAFTAALTVALTEHMDAATALRFACFAGSTATKRRGAQPSLPLRNEMLC